MGVYRCFTEKRNGFNTEALALFRDLRDFLGIRTLLSVRILCRYDIEGIPETLYMSALNTVFSEPQTDNCYNEIPPDFGGNYHMLIVEALPGQYDQRADSCVQCVQLLAMSENSFPESSCARISVKTAKVYIFYGDIDGENMGKLRAYLINPVEAREAPYKKPVMLAETYPDPAPVMTLGGFIAANDDELQGYLDDYGLAMDISDLRFTQAYFRDEESRDPTETELRVIDTYWSDHCRHTTFNTHLTEVIIDDPVIKAAYDSYLEARREVYGEGAAQRPQTLMDLATIAAKVLRGRGLLAAIDISEEINACSVHVNADVNGNQEDWLLSFKNETHNHPTEVEPFGGAATCIGGAIRDPLAGRAYVYHSMRITGSGNPQAPVEDTLSGKLPQRKLTVTAAQGFSSYGNQIGLAAGLVHEIYHPGFTAKRMELGAVVGAVKAEHVVRKTPEPGDKILLLGGRTGRDGIGGATGSSKSHTAGSRAAMASEVQKGNAPEERKIQRLFLDPDVIKIIKRCNDFGAGGVSVAVGELSDGLEIDLSLVRRKYEGLNATEIAISESQERMAVVIAPHDVDSFIDKAASENLEAYEIAEVTGSRRLVMRYESRGAVDLSRKFLSANGAVKHASVYVPSYQGSVVNCPQGSGVNHRILDNECGHSAEILNTSLSPVDKLRFLVKDVRFCSQRGLHSMFDGTVGASSVLMKSGGKTQSAPVQAMASLLPVGFSAPYYDDATATCSVMSFGYDPFLSSENPFAGAKAAVVTSVAKLVASGCDPDGVYLSFQEYFEQLSGDPARWGRPFSALLGAFEAQMELELAAIGGKDSMSGSFHNLSVPPTLVSFAVAPNNAEFVISPEFKEAGNNVVLFGAGEDPASAKKTWRRVRKLIEEKAVISAWAVVEGGAAEGIFKMALGNEIGFEYSGGPDPTFLFAYSPGAIVAEVTRTVSGAIPVGRTISEPVIKIGDDAISIAELKSLWESGLEDVFPTKAEHTGSAAKISHNCRSGAVAIERWAKPRALIFTFPGTNSEIDTARAVSRAGGVPQILVVRNLTRMMLEDSIIRAEREIKKSQIIIIPGGFSFGDEPDGSAKFIAAFFRCHAVTDAIHEHLKSRGGLILGICNGFQALIKLGLVPFGEIIPPDPGSSAFFTSGLIDSGADTYSSLAGALPANSAADMPALTHNLIGRHQAGYVYTRVSSVNSPWMNLCSVGDVHAVAISHGEGRFIASDDMLSKLAADGRIATQYTDIYGEPSMDILVNPNGSSMAVEGLFSPDGRVFGKMGHSERRGDFVAKNIYGNKHQPVFESGMNYFS